MVGLFYGLDPASELVVRDSAVLSQHKKFVFEVTPNIVAPWKIGRTLGVFLASKLLLADRFFEGWKPANQLQSCLL